MSFKTQARKTVQLALRLPSTYAPRTKIEGNLKDGRFIELRRMQSPTLGHLQVWAAREVGQEWQEINGDVFTAYALEIIGVPNPATLATASSSDFAYPTIEGFEELVGYKVGGVFKDGWLMARMMNSNFKL